MMIRLLLGCQQLAARLAFLSRWIWLLFLGLVILLVINLVKLQGAGLLVISLLLLWLLLLYSFILLFEPLQLNVMAKGWWQRLKNCGLRLLYTSLALIFLLLSLALLGMTLRGLLLALR